MLRFALANEIEEDWPEVAFIFVSESFACCAEGLTGARACPNRSVIGPPGKTESETPSSDSSEEVTLCVACEFMWFYFEDAPFVNDAGSY